MYEGQYRQALDNAGFKGFRVITFESGRAIQGGVAGARAAIYR